MRSPRRSFEVTLSGNVRTPDMRGPLAALALLLVLVLFAGLAAMLGAAR